MNYLLIIVSAILSLFIMAGCATTSRLEKKLNDPLTNSETRTIYIGDPEEPSLKDKDSYERWVKSQIYNFELDEPTLTDAKIEKIYVPDRIEGNRFIESHYVYIIKKVPTWTK